mgnify:FL=1
MDLTLKKWGSALDVCHETPTYRREKDADVQNLKFDP